MCDINTMQYMMALRPGAICNSLSVCNSYDGCNNLHSPMGLTSAWDKYSLTFNGKAATNRGCNSSCLWTTTATAEALAPSYKTTTQNLW